MNTRTDHVAAYALKCSLAWRPLVAIAIANGAARDPGDGRSLGERRAHQVSTLAARVLFGIYIRFALRRLSPASMRGAWSGGGLWLVTTVACEFRFGHQAAGESWPPSLENDDPASGHWWPLIPLWVCVAPPLFHWRQCRRKPLGRR